MPLVRGPDGSLIPHTSVSPDGSRAASVRNRQRRQPLDLTPAGGRKFSPDKRHVSFGRRLVRGPSPAYSRSTPSRSALPRPPVETVDISDSSECSLSPSDQLLSEADQALKNAYLQTEHGGDTYCPPRSLRFMPVTMEFGRLNPSTTEQLLLQDIADEIQRDNEVCGRVHKLRARVVDYARAFVGDTSATLRKAHCLEDLCGDVQNAQLVRYIGCLALGAPNLAESWRDLLADSEIRVALVIGIIGTALKEHAFSELWFGGTEEQIEELERLQERQKNGDGYERTKHRAKACNRYTDASKDPLAVRKVVAALEKMLTPLYCMGQKSIRQIPEALSKALFMIVTTAGHLSREMRRCADVIYHWPPTFKDEEFDPERMECINIADMISNSPYEKEVVGGYERSVLKEGAVNSEAIVKVVAFPGLVVHRQGGGALAKRLLQEETHDSQHFDAPPDVLRARRIGVRDDDKLTGDEGFRTRVLCKSVVHLVWGRQRLLTKEAGTPAHLDAKRDGKEQKYEDDRKGFTELYDYFLEHNPHASRALG